MRRFKTLVTLSFFLALLCTGISSFSQDFSNKGKDFWVAYGNHASMFNADGTVNTTGGSQDMVLYFTSDRNAVVTVSIPASGWTRSYNITANQVTTSDILPKSGPGDARILAEGKSNKGIHITSTEPVIAYAHIYDGAISGASLLFPTTILTNEYYSINFKQTSNDQNSYSYCYVVAVEDNTTIEVIPSANTINHLAGEVVTVTLNKGEVFNLFGRLLTPLQVGTNNFGQPIYLYRGEDLTGTKIRSIAGNNATCKKIAVYSGSGKINVQCAANVSGTSDNYMQQAFPPNAWGQNYLTAPTIKMPNNFYRICVSDPATVVKRNGIVLTGLINNFYYEYQSSTPDFIESSKPVMLAQYITTRVQCGNPNIPYTFNGQPESLGDPEMIYLSPIEQTIEKVTINSTPNAAIREHYINILIKNTGATSLKIDGALPAVTGIPHPNISGYRYYQIPLTQGAHTIQSDSGFNAIAYGYGNAESYGYNAGTNVKDLYQFITIRNQFATAPTKEACSGTPFYASLTLPYIPLSIQWKFSGYPDVVQNGPVTADSTYMINGRTVYVFRLSNPVVYNTLGTYLIDIVVNNPTSSGCTGEQSIRYELNVTASPVVNFTWASNGCVDSATVFTTNNLSNGKNIIGHYWDFGDSTYSNLQNPIKFYNKPGTFKVRYSVVTDGGCVSDTIEKTILITRVPVAKFLIENPFCANKPVLFRDSSYLDGAYGAIRNWSWQTGTGATITKTTNESLSVVYPDTLIYLASLQVITNSGCSSSVFSLPIKISPNPVSDFSFSDACLPNAVVSFTNLSSLPGNTAASLAYQWNFGEPGSGAANLSGNYQPTHTYTSEGPFTVQLTATSGTGCTDTVTKQLQSVYPQPKVGIQQVKNGCANTSIQFSDASTAGRQQITNSYWAFFNQAGTRIATSFQKDTALVFTTPGMYSVKHWVTSDKNCSSDTATQQFMIYPKPVAGFENNSITCEKTQILFSDTSTVLSGSINRRFWNMGDGTILNGLTNQSLTHTYTSWGLKTIQQLVESDKGCLSDTVTQVISIHPLPKAGFSLPEICINDSPVLFTNTSSIADNSIQQVTYNWNFNAGPTPVIPAPSPSQSMTPNPSVQFNLPGSYGISLIAVSANGCSDSLINVPFTVNGGIISPAVNFINGTDVCNGQQVSLQHRSTVDAGTIIRLEIIWDDLNSPATIEIDDDPLPDKIYRHSYPLLQPGETTRTYRIRYRVYSGIRCMEEITKDIRMHIYPQVQFLPVRGFCFSDSSRLLTQATELTGVAGSGKYTGPGIDSTGLFNPALAGPGKHTIRYTFTSAAGCTAFAEQTVEVWPNPVVDFTIQSTLCEKNNLQFTSTASNPMNTWKWNFGDQAKDSIITATAIQHQYDTAARYKVSLTATDTRGCISSMVEKQIQVHPLPRPDFRLPKICLPGGRAEFINLSTISDNTNGLFSYQWSFGDPNGKAASSMEAQKRDPVFFYTSTGPFTVNLKVTSAAGCVDSVAKSVTEVFPQPVAMFTVKDSACINEQLLFSDQSTAQRSAIAKWYWRFGNGTVSSLSSPNSSYSNPGNYNVQLVVQNNEGCISDTLQKRVSVWGYPVVDAGPDIRMLENERKQLSAVKASGSGLVFWWSPPDYLNSRTIQNPVIVEPKSDQLYTIEVTGLAGCKSVDEVAVKVLRLPTPPNTFTPNGDGVNDVWEIKYLNDFPGAVIEIYNTAGTLLYRSVGYSNPWDGKLNGQALPAGTYYYVIDLKQSNIKQKGFITILR